MAITITILIAMGIIAYIAYELHTLKKRIDVIEKRVPEEEYKKHKDDIKTLFQNQTLLLSLVNSVRVRINNFYAKKLKEPRFKSTGFEPTKEFGEEQDSV